MTRFFEEFVETAKARAQTPEERKSIARNYRYAREGISLAVVEAHGCYLDIMKYGKNKEGQAQNGDDEVENISREGNLIPLNC